MKPTDIVEIAIKLKKIFNTNDPFKILEVLEIDYHHINFRKDVVQAYTLRPYDDKPPSIVLNSNFDRKSQRIFCAHELGHAILHKDPCNHFNNETPTDAAEFEANLFAVSFLFDTEELDMNVSSMDNYMLKFILNSNVNYN